MKIFSQAFFAKGDKKPDEEKQGEADRIYESPIETGEYTQKWDYLICLKFR
jgi:hypothetical protein